MALPMARKVITPMNITPTKAMSQESGYQIKFYR
jgi:hypothetical protein